MKTILSALVLAFVLSAVAQAETYVERDRNGNRIGSLTQEGSRTIQRDKNGNAEGYFIRQGNTIEHRDIQGRKLGSTEIR